MGAEARDAAKAAFAAATKGPSDIALAELIPTLFEHDS
jgi:hypothetical protein